MKIVQVLNHFLPHQTAGTEVYTWALSKRLQQNNHEVTVIIPNYGETVNVCYEYDSLTIIRFAEPSVTNRSLIMGKRIPEGIVAFKKLIEFEKPDIVHFHELAGSNGITLHHVKAAKEAGAKIVMTFHLAGYTCRTGNLVYKGKELCDGVIKTNRCSVCYLHSKGYKNYSPLLVPVSIALQKIGIDPTCWNNKLGTALGTAHLIQKIKEDFNQLIGLCDKVVVLTEWYKKVLLLNGVDSKKIVLIKQGLPLETIVSELKNNKVGNHPVRLMFLGRISPFKGLHLLLEALQSLPETKISLDIYGQPTEAAYEKNCRQLTEGKTNINWKGVLQQQEVVATMQNYDALCLCSTFSEMSPLVIQEAFAAGIPILASNVYGNAEQVRHDWNGLLFTFNSVTSLREQLRRCIDNPNLLNELKKNNSSARSFEEVASDYDLLYRKICSQKT
jgi:glycosyltransferase involved in cell wall biosynthesis